MTNRPPEPRTVLFVCVENTFRSVLSEAIFNSRAPPGWKAESAGVRPAAEVNPVVYALLGELGIPLGEKRPRLATPQLIQNSFRVVTFGCLESCPIGAKEKAEDWPISGATGRGMEELREIRQQISEKIDGLILRLPWS